MAGGFDIAASVSASDSNSSGYSQDFRNLFGDHIIGNKPTPPWVMVAIVAGVVVIAALWIIRR